MKKLCFLVCLVIGLMLAAGCTAGSGGVQDETAASIGSQDAGGSAVDSLIDNQTGTDHGDNSGKPDENIGEAPGNTSEVPGNTGDSADSTDKSGGNGDQAGRDSEQTGQNGAQAGQKDDRPVQKGGQAGEDASGSDIMPWPSTRETVNDIEGVSMTIKEGTLTPTGLTVILENTTDKSYLYGERYILEKKVEGTWYKLKYTFEGNFAFLLIGYTLKPGGRTEWMVRWDIPYGTLDEGEYRILKDISLVDDENVKPDDHWLAAEFTIAGQ